MYISALYYYPIKSCAGLSAMSAETDLRGLRHDRRWLIIDEGGVAVTQRENPRMALVKPTVLENGDLSLAGDKMPGLTVPVAAEGQKHRAKVWSDFCRSIDQGEDAAKWLSEFMRQNVRLVRMADDFTRRVDGRYAKSKNDQVSYADGFPFLIVSQESLDDLNGRLAEPLPMNRFRPNIVVSESTPFAEDDWRTIAVGDMLLDIVKPCARCQITTINQDTIERGQEPLRTLATYRNDRGRILFGQNVIPRRAGRLAVGDAVNVLETRESSSYATRT